MTAQKPKLLFSRNPNPRLAVATARYLEERIEFEFAAPFAPGRRSARLRFAEHLSMRERGSWMRSAGDLVAGAPVLRPRIATMFGRF